MNFLKQLILILCCLSVATTQLLAQTTPTQFGEAFIQSFIDDDKTAFTKLFPSFDEFYQYIIKKGLEAFSEEEQAEMREDMQYDREYYIDQRHEIIYDADRYGFDWSSAKDIVVLAEMREVEEENEEGETVKMIIYYIKVNLTDGQQTLSIQFDQVFDLEPNVRLAGVKSWNFSKSLETYPASTPQEFVNSYAKALQAYDYNMLFHYFPSTLESVEIVTMFGEVKNADDEIFEEDYAVDNWYEYQDDILTFYDEMESAEFEVETATITIELDDETEEVTLPDGSTAEIAYKYCDIQMKHGERLLHYSFEFIKLDSGYKIMDMVLYGFDE